MLRNALTVPLLLAASPCLAQVTGFTAVAEVAQGAPYQITYQGTLEGGEAFGFTRRGETEMVYRDFGNSAYDPEDNPVPLFAPDEVGEYDAVITVKGSIAWRLPITVAPAYVSMSAPEAANPASYVEVNWTGPGGFDNRIKVANMDDPDNQHVLVSYATDTPASVRLPDTEGDYELRYTLGEAPDSPVLARQTIRVSREAAYELALAEAGGLVEITVPSQAQTGAPVDVGFGNLSKNWMVQFVKPGSDDFIQGQGDTFSYLVANPMRISAPVVPCEYEVVALDPNRLVRARVPVSVVPASASVAIASDDQSLPSLEVRWEGPGGSFDRVGFARVGAPAGELETLTIAYVMGSSGSVLINRPERSGSYELRYVQSVNGVDQVLTAIPYQVR